MFDTIIFGGKIVDGTGKKSYVADIGLQGDIISAIGQLQDAECKTKIDASGLVVSPGFIDSHSHTDCSVFVDNRSESQIRQGVTTELTGLCGYSLAPCNDDTRMAVQGLCPLPIKSQWKSFSEYLEAIADAKPSTNIASLVGHGALRLLAMQNSDATASASPEAIDCMAEHLTACLEQGAFGLSTGLEYYPGKGASTHELETLCRRLPAFNALHASHARNRDKYALTSFAELCDISRSTGARLQISHINPKYGRPEGTVERALQMVHWLRDDGIEAGLDVMPTNWNFTAAKALLPAWAFTLPTQDLLALLESPQGRLRLKQNEAPIWQLAVAEQWERIRLFSAQKTRQYLGKTLKEIGEFYGCSNGWDALCQILCEEGDSLSNCIVAGDSFFYEDIVKCLHDPFCSVISDSIPSAKDGSLRDTCVGPNSFLWIHVFIMDLIRNKSILSLEEGIRRLTSLPASQIGLHKRGTLQPGNYADIVIFDDYKTDIEFNIACPKQYPDNVHYVFVNGAAAISNGVRTEQHSGRVLLKTQ